MGTWRGTGRRSLPVGAGALLISALGAGPAYAGSDNDDDDHAYVDDSCRDYHESWYFEHGYDYDDHWDDRWDDKDRWDKDHWDDEHWNKDWHQGDDWKKRWDEKDYYVKDGKVYDRKTDKLVFDLGKPLDVQSNNVPVTVPESVPEQSPLPKQRRATVEATEKTVEAPVETPSVPSSEQQKPAESETPTTSASNEVSTPSSSVATDETGKQTPVKVGKNAVGTDLAATDPWDDRDKDKDRDRDWDRDHDNWWDGWWEKESYTVDVSCYEDKESGHRWYDDRPVGKVEATEVKTVPKGGVNTGN